MEAKLKDVEIMLETSQSAGDIAELKVPREVKADAQRIRLILSNVLLKAVK